MAGIVRWKRTAKTDLREIYNYYLRVTDIDTSTRILGIIFRDLKRLADSPLLDREDSQFQKPNQRWYYLLDARYEVYYERVAPNTIRIVKIWPCKREDLDPSKI